MYFIDLPEAKGSVAAMTGMKGSRLRSWSCQKLRLILPSLNLVLITVSRKICCTHKTCV